MRSKSVFGQIHEIAETQARLGASQFVLPAAVIPHFERGGFDAKEVRQIISPESDIARLVEGHMNLSAEQTDRASRLAYIISLAEKVFGKREKAFLWLRLPNKLLSDRQPIEYLARESTTRLVEETLLQMEYGVFA